MRAFLAFATLSLIGKISLLVAADHYPNFKELAANEKEGVDYRVEVADRHSPVVVIAIHGGGIESGSEAVARQIAGEDWSKYIFMATKPKGNRVLHITSTHFDDPRALALVRSAFAFAAFCWESLLFCLRLRSSHRTMPNQKK